MIPSTHESPTHEPATAVAHARKPAKAVDLRAIAAQHGEAVRGGPAATWLPVDALVPWADNPRFNDADHVAAVAASIQRFGWGAPCIVNARDGHLAAGHTRILAAAQLHWGVVPVRVLDLAPDEAELLALADNRLTETGLWDDSKLAAILAKHNAREAGSLAIAGFSDSVVAAHLRQALWAEQHGDTDAARSTLAERFVVPPFSVLDARQGYWQDRKRAWIALGIQSELGRGDNWALPNSDYANSPTRKDLHMGRRDGLATTGLDGAIERKNAIGRQHKGRPMATAFHQDSPYRGQRADMAVGRKAVVSHLKHTDGLLRYPTINAYVGQGNGSVAQTTGTSIFDPVLAELAVRWFCPPAGRVLDPFAGGSVRGIVSAALGRAYTGVDLRAEQVAANAAQWDAIGPILGCPATAAPTGDATPGEAQAATVPPPTAPTWIVGDSRDAVKGMGHDFDMLLTCPPYGDLERYSDDPADLSTMEHDAFRAAYAEIISASAAALAPDRFAVFVVGDYRDSEGLLRNFVAYTIEAFQAAGMRLYNDAVLLTAVGSLPIRAGRTFSASRKLGRTHQNVLVFVKGDPVRATAACGPVDVAMPEAVGA